MQGRKHLEWILSRLPGNPIEDVHLGSRSRDGSRGDVTFDSGQVIGHEQTPEQIMSVNTFVAGPLHEQNTRCADTFTRVQFQMNILLPGLQADSPTGVPVDLNLPLA